MGAEGPGWLHAVEKMKKRAFLFMVPNIVVLGACSFELGLRCDKLLALQHRIESGEGLEYVARKYLIEAHKEGNRARD